MATRAQTARRDALLNESSVICAGALFQSRLKPLLKPEGVSADWQCRRRRLGAGNAATVQQQSLVGCRLSGGVAGLAVGETVILLTPPLPVVGVSIGMERGCQ